MYPLTIFVDERHARRCASPEKTHMFLRLDGIKGIGIGRDQPNGSPFGCDTTPYALSMATGSACCD